MALKSYKPTTPGQRGLVPVKSLTEGLTKNGGRNNTGRITMRRKGGGAKRLYRIVDFKRNKMDVTATVMRIEYDPNRTAFIALVQYDDGEKAYILAPQRIAIGDQVVASAKADIKPGNAMPFSGMPIGTIIHNIELKPGKGGQIARAAGTYAQFVGRDGGYAQIRLSSGELRLVRQECMATVGAVSNPDNSNQNFGKAGRMLVVKAGPLVVVTRFPLGASRPKVRAPGTRTRPAKSLSSARGTLRRRGANQWHALYGKALSWTPMSSRRPRLHVKAAAMM